jgi:hypothetical protein
MTWRLRVFVTVVSLIAMMFLSPVSAQAGKIRHANAVPADQVIDNDVFLTGQQPIIDGTVNGDVFIVGSDVTISGVVNGSVFVMAENLSLSGQISGNLYGATVELTQQENGQIERSLYALTLSLITDPESSIGRDLKTVAMSARMQGQTERSTAAIIGPWELFKILRDVVNQNIIGFVPTQPPLAESNSEEVSFHAVNAQRAMMRVAKDKDTEPSALVDWLLNALKSFLNFLIVGGLMLWIFPRQFQGWAEKVKKAPLAAAGYGAVVLINGYLLPGLILFLLVGLLLGLIYVSLSSLAWPVFWVGTGSLVALLALFTLATTFLSKAIVAYLAGTFIFSRVAPDALQYRVLPLLLGLLIYVPLAAIPYLGSFIGLVVTLLGLGAIWLSRKQAPQPVEAVVEAVPA